MGQPNNTIHDELESLKQAELKKFAQDREDFIKQTEGNRPKVNDPRAISEVKSELTEEELAKQNEATDKWINQYLK